MYRCRGTVKTTLDTALPADIAAMFSYVSTPHHTRQTGQLNSPRAKTCSGDRLAHCSAVFNQLPDELKCLMRPALKRQLKQLLLRDDESGFMHHVQADEWCKRARGCPSTHNRPLWRALSHHSGDTKPRDRSESSEDGVCAALLSVSGDTSMEPTPSGCEMFK